MASARPVPSVNEVKDKLRIVIFGPYEPPRSKSYLVNLKRHLIHLGYDQCRLVIDFSEPQKRAGENQSEYILRKSYHWVEHADVRVFLFLKDAPNEGVTLELKHMLDNFKDKIEYSVVCIEKGETSQLITGEIRLSRKLYRIDFKNMDDLVGKITGMLINFSKQLYYDVVDRN